MTAIGRETPSLFSGLSLSLAAHAALVSIFLIKTVFFKIEEIDYTAAIRVDLVGLPDKLDSLPDVAAPLGASTPSEASTPIEKTVPTPLPVEPEVKLPTKATPQDFHKEPSPLDAKKKQMDALAKIKSQAALEKIRGDLAKEHIQKLQRPSSRPIKGNIANEGTALKGLTKVEMNEYAALLDRHIKKNWLLPEWLSGKNYEAQVRVLVSRSGQLIGKTIVSSSGNAQYDQAALSTIEASVPFPIPPGLIAESIENRGFIVFFP